VPYIEVKNPTAQIEHEATTSKISEDQLFYAMSAASTKARSR
jgi:Fe-S cluster assembly protein SufB